MFRLIIDTPHLYFSKKIYMYTILPVNPLHVVLLSSTGRGFQLPV